jgi:hypothetical protein
MASVKPVVMTPTTSGLNFSITRPIPFFRFSLPPKMELSSLMAAALRAMDSL